MVNRLAASQLQDAGQDLANLISGGAALTCGPAARPLRPPRRRPHRPQPERSRPSSRAAGRTRGPRAAAALPSRPPRKPAASAADEKPNRRSSRPPCRPRIRCRHARLQLGLPVRTGFPLPPAAPAGTRRGRGVMSRVRRLAARPRHIADVEQGQQRDGRDPAGDGDPGVFGFRPPHQRHRQLAARGSLQAQADVPLRIPRGRSACHRQARYASRPARYPHAGGCSAPAAIPGGWPGRCRGRRGRSLRR